MSINNQNDLQKELSSLLTMQYDYPPNGMGSLGYKGNNLYRFNESDMPAITAALQKRAESYKHSYNVGMLAQEIITDLLDDGLIEYGGYSYKNQQKEHHSI